MEDADISIERLEADGIIERSEDGDGDGDGYRLDPSFVELIQAYEGEIEQTDGNLTTERFREFLPARAPVPDGIGGLDPTVLAEYCAAMELVDDEREGIAVMAILDQFRDPPPVDGSPSAFLPVRGDRLPFLLAGYEAGIVYVWREDCPPCDVMKEDFEDVFESQPDDLLLVSVYGPECPVLLDERFDVVGAPTVLFVRDGRVDSRMVGARERTAIESEIETLRDLADV